MTDLVAHTCFLCGFDVWNEPEGAPHPCCVEHEDELRAGRPCPACAASRGLNRKHGVPVPWGQAPMKGYPL